MVKPTTQTRQRTCAKTAYLVQHVYNYLEQEKTAGKLRIGVTRLDERAKEVIGLGANRIREIRAKSPESFPSCSTPVNRVKQRKNGSEYELVIRQVIMDAVQEKKIAITLDYILKALEDRNKTLGSDELKWDGCRSTLHNYMTAHNLLFRSRITNYYTSIRDSDFNLASRHFFLTKFDQYLQEDRVFIYIDESWVRETDIDNKVWSDGIEKGFELPPDKKKGRAWIFLAAGGPQTNWIQQSVKLWRADLTKGDYHGNMDAKLYHKWILQDLLPYVPKNAVLIHDQASYHKKISDESAIIKKSQNKQEIVEWLIAKGCRVETVRVDAPSQMIKFTQEMYDADQSSNKVFTKNKLLEMVIQLVGSRQIVEEKECFRLVREYNAIMNNTPGFSGYCVEFLELPVAHPELNPIELIWGQIKRFVRHNNLGRDLQDVMELAKEYTKYQDETGAWHNSWEHSLKYHDYWKAHPMDHDLREATKNIKSLND